MIGSKDSELDQYRAAARKFHESVESRIKSLERRADAQADMIADLDEKKHYSQLATSTSRCVVTEAHIEKLERIREAAAELVGLIDANPWHEYATAGPVVQQLREALKS